MLRQMLALALLALSADASTILYSDSGTFSSATPTTAFSGPNETWAFSFQADNNPAILESGNGGFDFAYSNFAYLLNGSPITITPTDIRFFTAANGGGFFICFLQSCGMGVFPDGVTGGGPQLYSGPTSAPILLPGPFSLGVEVAVNSVGYFEPDTTLQAVASPEPATLFSVAVSLLALCRRRLVRRIGR